MTTTPLPPPVPLTSLDCYIDPKDGKVKRYDQARADLEAENQRLREALEELLRHFTRSPSSLADSETRIKAHAALEKQQ